MIQLQVEKLFRMFSLKVVFMRDAAKEYNELHILHLVWPLQVPDRVYNRHHRLGIDGANHHFGDVEADFADKSLTFRHRYELFLCVSERLIYSLDLRLVFLQDLICLDIVALVAAEMLAVHTLS